MRERTIKVAEAARKLYDYLWANTGDTADWPVRMIVEGGEDLTQLTGLLNSLGAALKDEDEYTHVMVFHSLDGLHAEEELVPKSPSRFIPMREYLRVLKEKADWSMRRSFTDVRRVRTRKYILDYVETIPRRTLYHYKEEG